MPRRKDPEIYTYKLKSGKEKYGFKTYIGMNKETGKPIKVTRQGFDSRKEAEQAKIAIKAEGPKKVEIKRKNDANGKTVQQAYEAWLAVYQNNVRESTLKNNIIIWEQHIQPEFGNNYINHIEISHLQNYANNLAKNIMSYKRTLNMLHRIIKYAMLLSWCNNDPFEHIIIPKKTGKTSNRVSKNFYNSNELKDFLTAAKKYNYKYYTFFMILSSLGLRRGEAFALQWKNIDLARQTISIEKTVAYDKAGKKTINPTKTKASKRTLTISHNLLHVLIKYKKNQKFNKANDYVFCTKNGDFQYPQTARSWLEKIYKANSQLRQISTHGFRHTFATLLYEGSNKITPKDVQHALGHTEVATALNIYTHVTEKQKQNIENAINNLDLK